MDFTLVLLSGDTWSKLCFLMSSHGMPSHAQIGVCCPVSVTRTLGTIYVLIPSIHAYITHKTSNFKQLFDCDRTCAFCRQQIIFRRGRKNCENRILASSCLTVHPSTWIHSVPTGRIFKKLYITGFFQNPSRKFKFHYNRTKIKGTLHDAQYISFITTRSFLLRIRNVSGTTCRENQNKHFVFSNFFSFKNRNFYEIMWKNIVERGSPRVRIEC